MPWKADGTWEEEGAAGNLQSILNSVLGKETDQDTTSTQNTSNATTSNTDTTGSAYTDQTTMGSTTNNANTNSSTNGYFACFELVSRVAIPTPILSLSHLANTFGDAGKIL